MDLSDDDDSRDLDLQIAPDNKEEQKEEKVLNNSLCDRCNKTVEEMRTLAIENDELKEQIRQLHLRIAELERKIDK